METLNIGDTLIRTQSRGWTDKNGEHFTQKVTKKIRITKVTEVANNPRYDYKTVEVLKVIDSPYTKSEHLDFSGGFSHKMLSNPIKSVNLQICT